MSNQIEDGMGFAGLVPSAQEKQQEREMHREFNEVKSERDKWRACAEALNTHLLEHCEMTWWLNKKRGLHDRFTELSKQK